MLGFSKRTAFVVACIACVLSVPSAFASPPKVLLKDDFKEGFDTTTTWALLGVPGVFLADDGIVTTSKQGLYVRPPATNSSTGAPMFTKTSPGDFDHVKWMADTQHLSSNFFPGYDATPGKELSCNMINRNNVIAVCTPLTVVSRSSLMSLIITFMFEPAKLQMNWARASGKISRRADANGRAGPRAAPTAG